MYKMKNKRGTEHNPRSAPRIAADIRVKQECPAQLFLRFAGRLARPRLWWATLNHSAAVALGYFAYNLIKILLEAEERGVRKSGVNQTWMGYAVPTVTGFTNLRFCLLFVAVISGRTLAQSGAPGHRAKPEIYEDDEVKIAIPVGWSRSVPRHPEGQLFLEKDGYTLALIYQAGHASGGTGGRFIEAFKMPWLNVDDAWTCSTVLNDFPQPASRTLLFRNILINTADPHVRTQCGILKDLGQEVSLPRDGKRIESQRWFAGYFTSGMGGFFFDESDLRSGCLSKVYKLTSPAQKPEQLPLPEDANLRRIIQESIDIVNSIDYKRCEPKPSSPFWPE
jgi:hypothetical protein